MTLSLIVVLGLRLPHLKILSIGKILKAGKIAVFARTSPAFGRIA
ncbi:hypothetical protein Q5Y75_01095 [Ruegeria sp. 2205SS24-7]|nr:hypothetical protein [Ruegeria sp. 2205SS24-7]MDP5215803.1 hypothetical protein [Ruegeria sp. 2205SS24-7]